VQIPLSQVPRRNTLGPTEQLGAGALVDRVLRFIANHLEVAFVLFALPSVRGEASLTMELPLLALVKHRKEFQNN